MSEQVLKTPVLAGTLIRSVNFFNGRLLTGDDLRGEQAALRARLTRLGRLQAEGVAYGLEVQETGGSSTPQHPVVTIARGLALAPSGLALELTATTDVLLVQTTATASGGAGGLFADCQPSAGGTYSAGAGVYLLTIGPASQSEGLAPVNGLGNEPAPCNVADSVETVQFRLTRLALSAAELADKAHLRSRVAYRCFAPEALAAFTTNPFGTPPAAYGLVDELRAEEALTDDEVPLALIGWSNDDGVQFVDLWAVRRRLTRRAAEGDLAALAGDRRRAEAEAMFLQFQAQVEDLRTGPAAAGVRAADAFALLPPAGFVPLHRVAGDAGFDQETFFTGMPHRADPVFLEGARIEHLLGAALAYPPVDPASGEAVRLHLVRENQTPSPGAVSPQPYLLFTSGHVPYEADGRFDLALWNFANYAER